MSAKTLSILIVAALGILMGVAALSLIRQPNPAKVEPAAPQEPPPVAETPPPAPEPSPAPAPAPSEPAPAPSEPAVAVQPPPTQPAEPAPAPRWTREKMYEGQEDQQFFGKNFASGLTQKPWQLDLTEDQARALKTFEDKLGAAVKAQLQQFTEAKTTLMKAIAEAKTSGDERAEMQLWAEMNKVRTEQGRAFHDTEKQYYEGASKILTPQQLEQLPKPE